MPTINRNEFPKTEQAWNWWKTCFNGIFDKLQVLNELMANELGSGINFSTMTPGIMDKITKDLDNSACAPVQKLTLLQN